MTDSITGTDLFGSALGRGGPRPVVACMNSYTCESSAEPHGDVYPSLGPGAAPSRLLWREDLPSRWLRFPLERLAIEVSDSPGTYPGDSLVSMAAGPVRHAMVSRDRGRRAPYLGQVCEATAAPRVSSGLPMPGSYCCICGKFARVPFARCSYCWDSPSYHHGRCCPWKPRP